MPYSTIQEISDALDLYTVRIDAAQSDADYAQTEAARALSEIYTTGLNANLYTNAEIQKLKDELRLEFQQADDAKQAELLASMDTSISNQLPGLLNGYYGPYSDMQALYDLLLVRFGQSDAAIDNLLNVVIPGLQSQVDTVDNAATNVATDFEALEQSLKSVLVVYAADAAGTDQSLTAGSREYVQYVEYNGNPPTLPVAGTFIKFVGTGQSVWPVYASDDSGNNQSFEPGTREYVTFYESPTAPDLPVLGQTWVKYVGSDGITGDDGARGAGTWYIKVTSLPATSTAAQNAWNNAIEAIPDAPVQRDIAVFWTGTTLETSTAQRAFICQSVTSDTVHSWDEQERFIRGDLLVTDSVTASQIDSKGLSIYDESGNIILQATGGSAGINLSKVIGAGNFAGEDQINSSNISTLIASAAIGSAYIGNLDAAKITTGALSAARINLNGLMLENSGGQLSVKSLGISTPYIANEAVNDYSYNSATSWSVPSNGWNEHSGFIWVDTDGDPAEVSVNFQLDQLTGSAQAAPDNVRWRIQKSGVTIFQDEKADQWYIDDTWHSATVVLPAPGSVSQKYAFWFYRTAFQVTTVRDLFLSVKRVKK